jgi:hypothetical protein
MSAENIRGIPALVLGAIHSEIRVFQELVGVAAVGRMKRDADAGARADRLPLQRERLTKDFEDPAGKLDDILDPLHVGLQDRKFVAVEAGDHLGVADGRGDPSGDGFQKLVAELVAEHVVDALEAVEIDDVQREDAIATASARDLAAEAVAQERAIGKVGQRVVMGQMQEVALGPLAVGDVERGSEHVGHTTGALAKRRLRGQQHALLATAVEDLLLEARKRLAALEHQTVEPAAAGGVLLAEDLIAAPANGTGRIDAIERRLVGVHEDAVSVVIGRTDHRRNGVDDLDEALAAVAQQVLARAFALLQLALQAIGAALDDLLLLAHLEQVACAGEKLVVIDRALQEIRSAGLQRADSGAALLVDRKHHHRDVDTAGNLAKAANEFRAVQVRHLEIGKYEIGSIALEPGKGLDRIAERAHDDAILDRSGELRENVPVGHSVVENDNERHTAHDPLFERHAIGRGIRFFLLETSPPPCLWQ